MKYQEDYIILGKIIFIVKNDRLTSAVVLVELLLLIKIWTTHTFVGF